MDYVVYGAGAVGGVIGARLHQAGHPVTLVARGDHLAAITDRGLRLDTPHASELVRIPAVGTADEVSWSSSSAVVLTVKSHQTASALDDLAAHAPHGTPIITAQNGVSNEPAALRRFTSVYGACVMMPCAHLEPGVVVQRSDRTPGILDVGAFPTGTDEVAAAVTAALRSAGFASENRPDIMAWKRRKLIMNLANAVLACYRAGPGRDRLVEQVQAEGERVLAAAAIPVVSKAADQDRRDGLLHVAPADGGEYAGSTWQSLARGHRSIETDWLNGEIVLLGRIHGVPTPANEQVRLAANRLARDNGSPRSLDAAD